MSLAWRLKEHPLSEAWGPDKRVPKVTGNKFGSLVVVLFDGMVIEGWHNVVAARESGGPLHPIGLGSLDPVKYVIGKQCEGRKPADKAVAIAKCAGWLPPGRPSVFQTAAEKKGESAGILTARAIADYAGVSVRSVVRVKKQLRIEEEAMPDWEDDHEAAKRRIAELEEELDNSRLALQDLADRWLPDSQLSLMVASLTRDLTHARREVRDAKRARKRLEVRAKVAQKAAYKLEAMLKERGHEGI